MNDEWSIYFGKQIAHLGREMESTRSCTAASFSSLAWWKESLRHQHEPAPSHRTCYQLCQRQTQVSLTPREFLHEQERPSMSKHTKQRSQIWATRSPHTNSCREIATQLYLHAGTNPSLYFGKVFNERGELKYYETRRNCCSLIRMYLMSKRQTAPQFSWRHEILY